jgi:hypothetical protein
MRNKPSKESSKAIQDKFEKDINDNFCKLCHAGNYRGHHQFPYKYLKCPICGHTIEIKKKNKEV